MIGLTLYICLSGKGNMYAYQEEAPGNRQNGFRPVKAGMIGGSGKSVSVNMIGSKYVGDLCKEHREFSKYLGEVENTESKVMAGFCPLLYHVADIWIHIWAAAGECITHTQV